MNNELKNLNRTIAEATEKLRLAKANLKFAVLPAPQKRVAIMRDVLSMLALPKAQRPVVQTGSYCKLDLSRVPPREQDNIDLQAFVGANAAKCTVCGIGAIFLAHARMFDSITVDDDYVDDDQIIETLQGYFSESQLRMIETAFEGEEHGGDADGSNDAKGAKWISKYPAAPNRLRVICENVIRNKGTFVIKQVTA